MTSIKILTYSSIVDVPDEWNELIGDNIYMRKDFLLFMEQCDHCKQKYYLLYDEHNKLDTIFMTYIRNHYNLGMFTKINLYQRMTLIYVPLSVTRPGIIYHKLLNEALKVIKKIKGPKIILNLPKTLAKGYVQGLTCPKCILTIKWSSLQDYLLAMRSNYRYRLQKALKKAKDLSITYLLSNKYFNNEMYQCYLQVYNKSRIKVEKLPITFFQGSFFKIFIVRNKNKVVGFGQMLENKLDNQQELIFEFVGLDYQYNEEYDVYHRILLEIVSFGILNKYKTIDFGQTADDTKLKLGSKYTMLYAYLHHRNPLLNSLNKLLATKLSYKPIRTPYHIFKEDSTNENTSC